MILLIFFQQNVATFQHSVNFRNQAFSLSAVGFRREIKEDAVYHHGWRESNGRAWILVLLLPLGWSLLLPWWAWWPRSVFLLAHWRWAWMRWARLMGLLCAHFWRWMVGLLDLMVMLLVMLWMWMWMLVVRHPSWVSRNLK